MAFKSSNSPFFSRGASAASCLTNPGEVGAPTGLGGLVPYNNPCCGGTGTPGVANATSDGSLILACDPANPDTRFYVRVVYDEATSAFTFFNSAGAAVVEGVDFEPCETADGNKAEFLKVCKIDDVAGDSSNLVPYVELYCKEWDGTALTSTLIGTYTDETCQTAYAPLGAPLDLSAQPDAMIDHNLRRIDGASTFQLPATTTSWSYYVATIGDLNNPPTFTDSNGVVTPIDLVGFSDQSDPDSRNANGFFTVLPIFTTSAGDVIFVSYNEVSP